MKQKKEIKPIPEPCQDCDFWNICEVDADQRGKYRFCIKKKWEAIRS